MENVRDEVCSFDNLYNAMQKCKSGVTWKDSVSRCSNNGLSSVLKLKNSLDNDTYTIDDYYHFTIYEPKKREIVSTKFKDRIFQRSLCDNYLYHEISKGFIYDNGACQIGRGTDFSRNRLKTHLHKYYREHGPEGYVLKIDFKNYFGSTPHAVAKDALRKAVKDEWALGHSCNIVDSYNMDGNAVGLGLGSQITQLVQLLVLSRMDHYIKEYLRIEHYIRYMDDMVFIDGNKQYLSICLEDIRKRAFELGLSLNEKKTQIFRLSQGIDFLGFKFNLTNTGKVVAIISRNNVIKRKKKLMKYKELVLSGKMTKEKADACFESWKAHAKKGNSYKLIEHMDKFYDDLWRCDDVQKIDA